VTLSGTWRAPHHAQLSKGTVFEVYAGKGTEHEPPLVSLSPSSCIRGITFFYPEQRVPGVIAYPWTIQGRGMHGSVIDCTFVNAYMAIDFGTHHNELHYIRNCFGCPLKVGVSIDRCTDIGRIENVHFNPHYWARAKAPGVPAMKDLRKYLFANLVAFAFARTDWEYVHNTFCFGAKIGYRFHKSDKGTVNGNFLGIGGDWCDRALYVEASQPPGLLITNGEFVGGEGARAMMEVTAEHDGVVQLSNCAFWGPCPTAALLNGKGSVSLNQCNFVNHGKRPEGLDHEPFTVEVLSGDVRIRDCRFGYSRPDVHIADRVRTAIVVGNWFNGRKIIRHTPRDRVQIGLNVATEGP
jgi:hypothetical protein